MQKRKKLSYARVAATILLIICVQEVVAQHHSLITMKKHPDILSYQFNVSSQFNANRGAAPCGLEALFNGCTIISAITTGNARLLNLLSDQDTSDRLRRFNNWKYIVRIARTKNNLKERVSTKLLGLLKPLEKNNSKESKERRKKLKFLKAKLSFFADALVDNSGEIRDGSMYYSFTSNHLRETFVAQLNKYRNDAGKSNDKHIVTFTTEELDSYFDLTEKTPIEVSESIQGGEWLSSGEIDVVVQETHLAEELNTSIFTAGGTLLPGLPLSEDVNLTTNPNFEKFCKTFRSPEDSCHGLFIVYSKSSRIPSKKSNDANKQESIFSEGHWYSVVANKVGNVRQYLVSDSLNNDPKLNDKRLRELVELIEGDVYSDKSIEKKTPLLFIPPSLVVDAKEISNRKSLTKTVKKFVVRNRILLGITAGIVGLLAYRKLAQSKESSHFRHHKDLFGAEETTLHLFRSVPQGKLHGAHSLP